MNPAPRYVILEHDHPVLHWDLMLEHEEQLRTWRLASPPRGASLVEAEEIGLHRRLYLDYEGPVSGDRGTVRRWDWGTFRWLPSEPGCLRLRMYGAQLSCDVVLMPREDGKWAFWALGD